jgi:hypothetical protein
MNTLVTHKNVSLGLAGTFGDILLTVLNIT